MIFNLLMYDISYVEKKTMNCDESLQILGSHKLIPINTWTSKHEQKLF